MRWQEAGRKVRWSSHDRYQYSSVAGITFSRSASVFAILLL
jgi:hypothetical protein